ncbi:Stp1/IreP family PP2C-type Ser/Thr phosphatase [Actinocorallia sp. B10E7]|uniref:Stp1/IreP family PP2C-type Ser/Thr phosphatase n=1 Tax=Actinocorallia sp. B10E7 TaxID=3153558 RepID=UPI00325E716B
MNTPRIGIRYAARSDVGMLREGNEDSGYAGARLLAVADGMGGHVGGEIASAAAIETLRKLDTEVPADQLLVALEHSVKAANDKLHHMVEGDPSLQGMGTTLTAMLWSGSQVALAHIGDSRAYLLRNGELFQITHDHTLVQSLVDEGRISLDDAATHPQRSLLLRALDGRNEVEPDLSLREAQVGDRYLLCSDGLSGVVSAETIHQVLTAQEAPEGAIRQLIDLANRGGGPDNITCVVADVIDLDREPPSQDRQVLAGAAANKAQEAAQAAPQPPRPADTPAQRAADHLRDTLPQPGLQLNNDYVPPPSPAPAPAQAPAAQGGMPQPYQAAGAPPAAPPPPAGQGGPPGGPPHGRRKGRPVLLLGAAGVVGLLVIAAGYFGYTSLNKGFYLAAEGQKVVVFKGTNKSLFGLPAPSKAPSKEQPDLTLADLPNAEKKKIRDKSIHHDDLAGIRQELTRLEGACKIQLRDQDEIVVIVRGEGQPGCPAQPLTQDPRSNTPLPRPDVKALPETALEEAKSKDYPTVEAAVTELVNLQKRADNCKATPNQSDCPK